jgi:hypothetical protein
VQLIGTTVTGAANIRNSTSDVTIAGSRLNGGLALTGNTQVTANERYSRLAGAYGPILSGSVVNGLTCADNSAAVKDFGAPNVLKGSYSGCALGPIGVDSTTGGTVPATLALTLGPAVQFGALTPGVTKTYTASTTATVISTAGDATLSIADPATVGNGHLVNGTFVLAEPLQVGGSALPATAKTWAAPISNDVVTLPFSQLVKSTDPLRTGTYAKSLTFTLSTTTP